MKNKFCILLFSVLVISLMTMSCKTRPQEQQASDEPFLEFLQFHKQFLEDSIFQIEHILFPLEGLPSNADSATLATNNFRWQKEDWQVHRPFNFENSDYEQQFIPFDDGLILENIVHKSGGYVSERRFAKIEGVWYLIYYGGLNQVK